MKKHYFMAFLLSLFFLFALPVQGMAVAGGHGGGSTSRGGSGGGFGGVTTVDDYSDHYSRASWGRRGYGYYSPYGSSSVIENYVLVGASVGGAAILSLVKRKKTNEPEGMIYSLKFLVIKRKRKNCLTKSNRLFCDPNRLGSRCT
ncbi:hypothetical protein OM428_06530 [Enterococcus gallinarum]|nr:hypothetical protein [Enterococcus gallinarum]MCW3744634.1 hypothetical protein [Enterococcus gallinarum]